MLHKTLLPVEIIFNEQTFLFISSTMSNTCSLSHFGVQIVPFTDQSFLQISRRKCSVKLKVCSVVTDDQPQFWSLLFLLLLLVLSFFIDIMIIATIIIINKSFFPCLFCFVLFCCLNLTNVLKFICSYS